MKETSSLPIGTPVGFLKILEYDKKINSHDKHRIMYKCECICGKIVYRAKSYIHKKINTNCHVSCGCKHPSKEYTGNKSKTWRGYGDVGGQFYASLKHGANTRKIEVLITKEDIWNQYLKQDGKCALTNLPVKFCCSPRKASVEQTASVDRIDSSKGYTKDNIQITHKEVNRMKWSLTQDRFIEMCKLVAINN